MRNAVRSLAELEKRVSLTEDERAGCQQTAFLFRLGITPYYLSLIDPDHPFCPVRMQSIPVRAEARVRPGELKDPLGEDQVRPVSAIVHKYPDRVLLLAVDGCSVYCRHCTRRRITRGAEAAAQLQRPNRHRAGSRLPEDESAPLLPASNGSRSRSRALSDPDCQGN